MMATNLKTFHSNTNFHQHEYFVEDRDDFSKYTNLAGAKSFAEAFSEHIQKNEKKGSNEVQINN